MKRNKPTPPAIYGGLPLHEAIEFKICVDNKTECKRYFELVQKRTAYLQSLHSQLTTTFLPQPNNFKPAYKN